MELNSFRTEGTLCFMPSHLDAGACESTCDPVTSISICQQTQQYLGHDNAFLTGFFRNLAKREAPPQY
ncbi:MAG: hypothetical protein ACYDAO_06100 [Thermoplasmataceae archaeon]